MQSVTIEPNEKTEPKRPDTMTTWLTSTWHAPEPETEEEGLNKDQAETKSEEDSFHKLESKEEPNITPEILASSQSQQKASINPDQLPRTPEQDSTKLDDMSKEIWINLPKEFTREKNDLTLLSLPQAEQ